MEVDQANGIPAPSSAEPREGVNLRHKWSWAEALIQGLPVVNRAALFRFPGDDGVDRLCLVVEPQERSLEMWLRKRNEWESIVRRHCQFHSVPVDHIFFQRALPLDPNDSAQIDYEALRRAYRGRV